MEVTNRKSDTTVQRQCRQGLPTGESTTQTDGSSLWEEGATGVKTARQPLQTTGHPNDPRPTKV